MDYPRDYPRFPRRNRQNLLQMQGYSGNSGFTLVEMAVVMVIIAVLIGGTLVGTNLLKQGRIRRSIAEVDMYKTAFLTFMMKYDAMPGDMPNATDYFTGISNGDGNQEIQWWNEGLHAWVELEQAEMIPSGGYVGTAVGDAVPGQNVPYSAYDKKAGYSFAWEEKVPWQNNFNMTGNVIHFGKYNAGNTTKNPALTPAAALAVDEKLDDGRPARGVIHSWDTTFTPSCVTASSPDADYKLDYEGVACSLLINLTD